MFTEIDIALIKGSIAIDTGGLEYEVLEQETATCLILNQILDQLKLSTSQCGFAIENGTCIFLREINSTLEPVDESVRFDIEAKQIFNLTDIYLFNKLINEVGLSKNSTELLVRWGKKLMIYTEVIAVKNQAAFDGAWEEKLLRSIGDSHILDQRFWILLNHTFLNKLKSYTAYWQKKYNLNYQMPVWYDSLYQNTPV